MDVLKLVAGQSVMVEPEAGGRCFQGKVEDARPHELRISLGAAARDSFSVGLSPRVSFAHGGLLHQCRTRVLRVERSQGVMLALEPPVEFERVQRRKFPRYRMRVPVTCVRLDERGGPRETFPARMLEIGGDGLGMVADRRLAVGERVRFKVDLEGFGRWSGVGQVRRADAARPASWGEYVAGVQFTDVGEEDLAKLLAYANSRSETGSSDAWF